MVSAFEQNLYTMTNRIQQLTRLSNEKENDLNQFKLLIGKLLNVDDLKKGEIDQLIADLDATGSTTKQARQLMRRHTFTADEIKLNKCKSLETCAKLEAPTSIEVNRFKKCSSNKKSAKTQYLSNSQIDADRKETKSSWHKLTKAFKKSSLSKYSPMHRSAANSETKSKLELKINNSILKDNDNIKINGQLANEEDNLLINLSANLYNLSSNVSLNSSSNISSNSTRTNVKILDEEHLSLRKELDEKERLLCDLRLELLKNNEDNANLKERLSRLTKERSLSKVSLFSANSSIAESMDNASICNINLENASSIGNTNSLLNNSNNTISTNLVQSCSSNSSTLLTSNTLHSTSSNDTSKASLNKYLELSLKQAFNKTDDLLLVEGKLISVQVNLWNENCTTSSKTDNQLSKLELARNKSNKMSTELGLLRIGKQTKWSDLNYNLANLINNYLHNVDPTKTLGISFDSFCSYELGDSKEAFYFNNDNKTDKQPLDLLANDSNLILKLRCKSILDSFVLHTLISKSILMRLITLLCENKRLIIAGSSGTYKTHIASKLAEYLIVKLNRDGCLSDDSKIVNREMSELSAFSKLHQTKMPVGSISTYYVDAKNYLNLYHYLRSLIEQNGQNDYCNVPTVLIIENLQFIKNINETFGPLQSMKNYMPFIICTLNQDRSQHLEASANFKWFTLNNANFLSHFLRKKVIVHLIEQQLNYLSEFNLLSIEEKHLKDQSLSSLMNVLSDLDFKKLNSFKIIDWLDQVLKHLNHFIEMNQLNGTLFGSRIFTDSCPINDLDKIKDWFNQCWNRIVPFLIEISKNNQIEDPSIWIMKTYPFANKSILSEEGSNRNLIAKLNQDNLNLNKIENQVKIQANLDPLVNALTNLNKLTNQ